MPIDYSRYREERLMLARGDVGFLPEFHARDGVVVLSWASSNRAWDHALLPGPTALERSRSSRLLCAHQAVGLRSCGSIGLRFALMW